MSGAQPAARRIDERTDGASAAARDPDAASAATEAESGADRRRHIARRSPSEDRLSLPGGEASHHAILPRSCRYLVAAIPGIVAATSVLKGTFPPIAAIICFALALGVIGLLPLVRRAEGKLSGIGLPNPLLVLTVIVPLVLFGLGAVAWARSGLIELGEAVTMLVAFGAIVSAHLRRQAGMVVAGQVALWLPAMTLIALPLRIVLLGLGAAAVVIAVLEQRKLEHAENQRRQARERAQTRARDILADYEETGQGWFWETDRRSQLSYVSAPVATLLGHTPETLVGRPLTSLFDLEQSSGKLTVTVDAPGGGGADLAAISDVTKAISRALDADDPIAGKYLLEVTSPGVERPLRTPDHFTSAVGKEITVRLNGDPENERERRYTGVLQSADDTGITLTTEGGETVSLDYGDIQRARTVFDFEAELKAHKHDKPAPAGPTGKRKRANAG